MEDRRKKDKERVVEGKEGGRLEEVVRRANRCVGEPVGGGARKVCVNLDLPILRTSDLLVVACNARLFPPPSTPSHHWPRTTTTLSLARHGRGWTMGGRGVVEGLWWWWWWWWWNGR